jgi:RNA polymerase sigma-70 factor (ECF subfamily)
LRFRAQKGQIAPGLTPDAFLRLYDERSRDLVAFFAQRTLDAEVAADLTAETFAAAFQVRANYKAERGDPAAWLFGIARHKLADYLRDLRVDRKCRLRLGMPIRTLSDEDLARVEELIDFATVGRQVQSALSAVPHDQREAVVSRVVEGLSYAEIAERAGCSEQVARARVSRGLRTLARLIAGITPEARGDP